MGIFLRKQVPNVKPNIIINRFKKNQTIIKGNISREERGKD